MFCIVAHSGAGLINQNRVNQYRTLIGRAVDLGLETFEKTKSINEAIQSAIETLENDQLTNAGNGGNLTETGNRQNEAGFAFSNSSKKGMGSVAMVTKVPNPIRAAKKMAQVQSAGNDSFGRVPPILLAGADADRFCKKFGFFDENLEIAKKSTKTFQKYRKLLNRKPDRKEEEETEEPSAKIIKTSDTVGAIGILVDDEGTATASGSSSGGLLLKRDGRIGSAATTGAGFWADSKSCATTSGNGEEIIKQGTARMCCRYNFTVEEVIEDFLDGSAEENGDVGLVKLEHRNDSVVFEFGHSTKAMNMAVGTLFFKTSKRKTEIIQSVKSESPFTSGAYKFKIS